MMKQNGFTLIELIMVIVILGLLAATALPKFVDLSNEAEIAALDGVAGSLSSANTINYGVESLNSASGVTVNDCNDGGGLLEGGIPSGYTAVAGSAVTVGVTTQCALTQTSSGRSKNFSLTGVN